MSSTLLALHGFTQNGGQLRTHLAPLLPRLPAGLVLECPDAPHICAPESVAWMYGGSELVRPAPPHLSWWNASDDGRVYRGWERTRQWLEASLPHQSPLGLLGFSQGAILTATVAALAARGELPLPRFVVLVAGRMPRADALRSLFDAPVSIPSLHVWGQRDPLAGPQTEALVECFDPAQREVVVWRGPHIIPTHGPGADAIVNFIQRHA